MTQVNSLAVDDSIINITIIISSAQPRQIPVQQHSVRWSLAEAGRVLCRKVLVMSGARNVRHCN